MRLAGEKAKSKISPARRSHPIKAIDLAKVFWATFTARRFAICLAASFPINFPTKKTIILFIMFITVFFPRYLTRTGKAAPDKPTLPYFFAISLDISSARPASCNI